MFQIDEEHGYLRIMFWGSWSGTDSWVICQSIVLKHLMLCGLSQIYLMHGGVDGDTFDPKKGIERGKKRA